MGSVARRNNMQNYYIQISKKSVSTKFLFPLCAIALSFFLFYSFPDAAVALEKNPMQLLEKTVEDMNLFYLRRPPGMRFCYACHKKF